MISPRFYFDTRLGVGDLMGDARLFGPFFSGDSWNPWRAVVKAAFAEPMDEVEIAAFRAVASRDPPAKRSPLLAGAVEKTALRH